MDIPLALRIDEVCARFEHAWREGPPRIEDYLGGWQGPERAALVRELVRLDVEYRNKGGEPVSEGDYHDRFPDLRAGSENATRPHAPAAEGRTAAATLPSAGPRYRVLRLLGRGGMGDVYLAEDLKLGEEVALKFLPPHLAADADRLARFRKEVALARRINHPHVCRIHDIGEADGRTFLSMEYIDGEDLGKLLQRVGRLAEEEALKKARQLCAALAAVHEQKLLHRDLKPANVMLDGRGRVKLADFGLATFADNVIDVGSGTPAYQAPEQLARREVTVQSDLFALGLVLYEVFTGQRAYPTAARDNFVPPSHHVPGLSEAVEDVIRRCLEADPGDRPGSALEVLALLPGGLSAAAHEAGTPLPPEYITRGGGRGGLSLGVGLACLTAVVLALAGVVALAPRTMLVRVVPLPLHPEALRDRAQTQLKALGYPDRLPDALHGFRIAAAARPPRLDYWYRESAAPVVVLDGPTYSRLDRPPDAGHPPLGPGQRSLRLDPQEGRLVAFHAFLDGAGPRAEAPKWPEVFRLAGLEFDPRGEIDADSLPLPAVPCDARYGWESLDPATGQRLRIGAATCRGHLVEFALHPADEPAGGVKADPPSRVWFESLTAVVFLVCLGLAGYWSQDHRRRGLIDRSRALRFAGFFVAVELLAWVFRTHHVAGRAELDLAFVGLARALLIAAFCWLFYAALEPHARRVRPETLSAWNRLLGGAWRDPLVGRSVLLGVLVAVLARLFYAALVALPAWLGGPPARPDGLAEGNWGLPLPALDGVGPALGTLLRYLSVSVFEAFLTCLTLLILLGMAFPRPRWLAGSLWCAILTALFALAISHRGVLALLGVVPVVAIYFLLSRVGVLALAVCLFVTHALQFPLTYDPAAWYAPQSALALGTVLALAFYGFVVSRGGEARSSSPPRST